MKEKAYKQEQQKSKVTRGTNCVFEAYRVI